MREISIFNLLSIVTASHIRAVQYSSVSAGIDRRVRAGKNDQIGLYDFDNEVFCTITFYQTELFTLFRNMISDDPSP